MDLDLHYCARQLQSFNSHHFIHQGRQLHLLFLKRGVLSSALTIANRLLQMYVRCDHVNDAQKLFDDMTERNCFTWNTMVEGHMKSGCKEKSLELFYLMPERNLFSWNSVISGFARERELEIARGIFDEMPRKNWIAWNSMIHGYARHGNPGEALRLFKKLCLDPYEESRGDTFIMATVLGACTDMGVLDCGKQIHAQIITGEMKFDAVLASSLINLYGKTGDMDSAGHVLGTMQDPDDFSLSALISGYSSRGRIEDAKRIFSLKEDPCVVLWNTMIAGYVTNDEADEAILLFNRMRKNGIQEDSSTFASVLSACSCLGILDNCKKLHTRVCKFGTVDDLIISGALVDTYAKCGSPSDACKLFNELKRHDTILLNSMITVYSNCGRIADARQIFETMKSKSVISWNSMIVGLSQNGYPLEALDLFCNMNAKGFSTDYFSLASIISACASISSLELGEQVYARAIVVGLDLNQIVSTSLIDLYCKCGAVKNGRKLFDQMTKSDEASWNSMLIGYATNGYGIEAMNLFDEMMCAGIFPTDITFTGVLSACDHSGLVEEGKKWFYAMKNYYHIEPGIEHYSCMIDLFARAGYLEEALDVIKDMPFQADSSMWSSVLRGCVTHGNKYLAKEVAKEIAHLDPVNSGAYVQLASILATSEDWEGSAEIRKFMNHSRIQKSPGCSWVDC